MNSADGPAYADFLKILRRATDLLREDPVREEIFSVERLEQYATHLAGELRVGDDPRRGRPLLPDVRKDGRALQAAYTALASAVRGKQSVSPAAEWFLDNFHIVEEQLWGIRRDLPESYYDELPKLANGELAGYPRIYAIALAIIAHTDSRLDVEMLRRFLLAYQRVTPLTIGELWAIAITLRIALVEHLKPLAERIVSARDNRARADELADKILEFTVRSQPETHELIAMIADEMGSPERFDRAFVVQLTQRLRDQDPDVWAVFDWIERQLRTQQTDIAQVTQLELHRQAAAQVTVGNIITSMRLISALDWHDFFESVSPIDPILALDPAQAYAKMDFGTRDRYRHQIERLARRSETSEINVAKETVAMALAARASDRTDERRAHVGYYLIDRGLPELERQVGYRPRIRERISRSLLNHPTSLYLGSLLVLTSALVGIVVHYAGLSPLATAGLALLALLPASEVALSLVNYLVTVSLRPQPLPKMDTEDGIPEEESTLVVIPTLFTGERGVNELVENLQIHYLANPLPHLYFALLGDWGDAESEHTARDHALLELAQRGIDELNARYPGADPGAAPRFYVLHRRRQWNEREGKWMGWERKRGKLLEFNRLLRGDLSTSYLPHLLPPELMRRIRHVITLDSDTQLPRQAASRLIGTAMHPLNRPFYCTRRQRVTMGYGILQPRISVDLPSAERSRFARFFSGNVGLDPYTTAVSDVYQDLFAEGSFTGKGLYVVDAFEAALANRGPENAILSHDLFEGSYARTALVTDVELFDDYPSDYDTFEKRQHRWTRGDWQIARWLLPRVPDAQGRAVPNQLTLISRWKIFDNLRRSLVPPALLIWLALAWTTLPGSALLWSLPALLVFGFPLGLPLLVNAAIKPRDLPWREHFRATLAEARLNLAQLVLNLAFLASQARSQTDAVLRTLYRMFISKRKLLEWTTFAQLQRRGAQGKSWRERLGVSPPLALLLAAALLARGSLGAFLVAAPPLLLWLALPFLKEWLRAGSRRRNERALGPGEVKEYRLYARRTWHFFETFVTATDNWLAPDNFQEDPKPVVAHRTSPTNIGLQLLSTVAAYDFGYVGRQGCVQRLERTFETLARLERLHGHFYNWYDTQSLAPLSPRYVSTVDSGNLAGHLLALKQACADLIRAPAVNPKARPGLEDSFEILTREVRSIGKLSSRVLGANPHAQLVETIEAAAKLLDGRALADRLDQADDLLTALAEEEGAGKFQASRSWLTALRRQARELERDHQESADDLIERLRRIMERCDEYVAAMDFRFLYDEQRKIFVIGYNVSDGRRDNSYYDLLASESRLASFVAIAKGDVPTEHWFRLGRQMAQIPGGRALVAWTATMFEYLMPLLVMRRFDATLLDQSYLAVVKRQIQYGAQHRVPWGVSEAGYNARDLNLNFQYGPFGVPGLGLKRGLSDDLVISPYSTMLASVIDPWAALENLRALENQGVLSRYGFFESIDYTPERLPEGQKYFVLRSFMAHHQGMSLVSLDNLLNDSVMQRRFHADPRVLATQLLLQERVPRAVAISRPRAEEVPSEGNYRFPVNSNPRFYSDMHVPTPRTQILSNGRYATLVTSSGAGYSRHGRVAVTRWREDWTRDQWGQFFYVRDRESGKVWSPTYQPTAVEPDRYEVLFAEDKVEFLRQDAGLHAHTEIIVSPEDDVELRRVSFTNLSGEPRELELTSYLEPVLAPANDDAAHPAFSNLFVQTEFVAPYNALLATRRRRSKHENQIWGFHVAVVEGERLGPTQYETDRARFLGRGHTTRHPLAVGEARPLSQSVGSVLDPIFSLRESVRVPAHGTVRLTFSTGVAPSREEALRLADKYHDIHIFPREAEIAWTQSQVQLRHLNVPPEKAHLYQRLAGRIVFSDGSLRPRSHVLAANAKTQSALWAHGIGGDLPILLTRVRDDKDMVMVRELLHAHEYLRLKGLTIDLVILNERSTSYLQTLQDELQRQIRMSGSQALIDKPGGIFMRRADLMPPEDLLLLKTVARATLSAEAGTLEEQLMRRNPVGELPAPLEPVARKRAYPRETIPLPELDFFNGLGGFTKDGRAYQIYLREGQWTPAPWINVIANDRDFGCLVSEAGSGYTWSANSRENRLSPWSNDAVSDPPGEAIYLRDEESGEVWTPTPLPIRLPAPYLVTHGAGYSRFELIAHGLRSELTHFVPLDAEVKLSRLRIKNVGPQARKLSVTSYVEWVLGFARGTTAPTVVTEYDADAQAILARNPYNNEFAARVAFAAASERDAAYTGDRRVFLGRNGTLAAPAALKRQRLSGRSGAGLDPCAAFQCFLELAPGEEREVTFFLGQTRDAEEARNLVARFRDPVRVRDAFAEVERHWEESLGTLEVRTPDAALNVMVNRWLLYQTLACRVWARSAFYQSGGAFGFRDQLQDVMALVYAKPELTRAQILRAASRQFLEGDVQHWWHPPTGRGVRTHFSDDLLWLPFVTAFYVEKTGDRSVLEERVPFIEAPPLAEGQEDAYLHPATSREEGTVLEHCLRAIDRSLRVGQHGLPLMGSGDWNDGMNRVGIEGRGESVWVGWFLSSTIQNFLPHCHDAERADRYRQHLKDLKRALEDKGWDGDWYRRAYFDDGQALGSAFNEECRIDSIAQSWAVLSGVGDIARAQRAMAAVDEYLIHRGDGLIKLFTPPFDQGQMDPGYIKGYLPGVRENGGQYTHAAIWTVMAYAALGDGDRAGELFALLNPVNHASTRAGAHKYKVEPYVLAADVYGMHPHVGRGGWTWYTGSSSWMYRAAVESILGFDLRGDTLHFHPRVPLHWREFEMSYRRGATRYRISVVRGRADGAEAPEVELDGHRLPANEVPLVDDGREHSILVRLHG